MMCRLNLQYSRHLMYIYITLMYKPDLFIDVWDMVIHALHQRPLMSPQLIMCDFVKEIFIKVSYLCACYQANVDELWKHIIM